MRWPPHVNLLYPFFEEEEEVEVEGEAGGGGGGGALSSLAAAAEAATVALRSTAPFEVTLETFGVFHHGRSSTVWLAAACPPMVSEAELSRVALWNPSPNLSP